MGKGQYQFTFGSNGYIKYVHFAAMCTLFLYLVTSPAHAHQISCQKNSLSLLADRSHLISKSKISKLGETLLVESPHENSPVKFYKRTRGSLNYLYLLGGKLVIETLNPEDLKGKRVLDVGTSQGFTVRDLRRAGVFAEGIDIALNPQQKKERFFREEDAQHTSYEDQTFDLVLSSFSLFYYPELWSVRNQALRELSRITKPGGKILLIALTGYSKSGKLEAEHGRINDSFSGIQNEITDMQKNWSTSKRALDEEIHRLLDQVPDLEVESVDYQRQVVLFKKSEDKTGEF